MLETLMTIEIKTAVETDTQLFTDSDGVYAHFDEQVERMFGLPPSKLNDDHMWSMIYDNRKEFWTTMPLTPDALELWEFMRPFNPIVLSGCPKGHFDEASEWKKEWWLENFEWEHVITCPAKEKPLHIKNAGDVLADDFVVNVKRWQKAGGIGVLHKNVPDTIERLKVLLYV
jgi:hypothetical protein